MEVNTIIFVKTPKHVSVEYKEKRDGKMIFEIIEHPDAPCELLKKYGKAVVEGEDVKLDIPKEVCEYSDLESLVRRLAKFKKSEEAM